MLIPMLICVIMSGYFSATETAFNSLNMTKIKIAAEKGDKRAALIIRLLDDYNRLLTTILVGNNIVNIALSSMATVLFIELLGGEIGATVSTAVITVVVLIFGEITPKSIAKESPEAFARFSAPIINFLAIILTPINFLFAMWKKLVSLVVKSSEEEVVTEEELLSMVDEGEQSGTIGEQESELIRNAMELNENDCADIATPRVDIEAVGKDWSKEEVAEVFVETGYSRLPVYVDSIDNIIGIIHRTDFYNNYDMENISDLVLTKPVFVPTTMKLGALLKLLQKSKCHMAVVTDEYGGTMGIVTLEDVIEELVGEIWDEHDDIVREIEQTGEYTYVADGSASIEKVFRLFDMDNEVDSATVHGWVTSELEDWPKQGDKFEFENLKVTILEVEERMAKKVEMTYTPPAED